MKLPSLPARYLWLIACSLGFILWLAAASWQQAHENALHQDQQLREAELLVDNVARQLQYAIQAGQASTELLLADGGAANDSNFARFAPAILNDGGLFDFVATTRQLSQSEREEYELQQAIVLREYRNGSLAPASKRPAYFALELQYPEDSRSLPSHLELGSQAGSAAALKQVRQSGQPAIAQLKAGNASRLVAYFASRARQSNQLVLLGFNTERLLGFNSSDNLLRPQLTYRLRILLKDDPGQVLLDSHPLAQSSQIPILVSTRFIGGQSLLFELYPEHDKQSQQHASSALSLLAILLMAAMSGVMVLQSQRQHQGQRTRLRQQARQNRLLTQQHEQHQQHEVRSREAIQRLRAIVEGSGDAILVISQDGLIRDINRAAESMLGQPRQVLLSLPAGALISELHPAGNQGFELHVANRLGKAFEAMMICSNTQTLQIEVSLTQIAQEQEVSYIAVCRDITERKASEEALIKLKDSLAEQVESKSRQLSALLEASPMAMAYIVDRRYRQVNRAFLSLFQRHEAEVVGQSTRLLYDSDEQYIRTGKQIYPILNTGEVSQDEILLQRGTDEPIWVYMYGKAVQPAKPEFGSVWLYQDVSAQRATEDNLRRAKELAEENSRAKTEFLANMSHELRTPMHAILGFAEMGISRADTAKPEKLRHYFDRIHHSGDRLLTLLNDLLDLSKMEVGKMAYQMQECDASQITLEAVDELRGMAQGRQVTLQLHGVDAPLPATMDAFRIGQLLRNLLGNAIKFSPPGETADITVGYSRANSQMLSFDIRDYGPGIPPAEREMIFNAFIQGTQTKTGAGGSGLGLAICREIVQAHHGKIEILPHTPGAHFRVTLPCKAMTSRQEQDHA